MKEQEEYHIEIPGDVPTLRLVVDRKYHAVTIYLGDRSIEVEQLNDGYMEVHVRNGDDVEFYTEV